MGGFNTFAWNCMWLCATYIIACPNSKKILIILETDNSLNDCKTHRHIFRKHSYVTFVQFSSTWYFQQLLWGIWNANQSCTHKSETIFGKWKPIKIIKNDFYFTLKALMLLKIFKFLLWFISHVKKGWL